MFAELRMHFSRAEQGLHGYPWSKHHKQRINPHFVGRKQFRIRHIKSAPFIWRKGSHPNFPDGTLNQNENPCPVSSTEGSLCTKQHSKVFTCIKSFNCVSKRIRPALLLTPILRTRKPWQKEVTSFAPDQHQWTNILLPESILVIPSLLSFFHIGTGHLDLEVWSLGARNGPGVHHWLLQVLLMGMSRIVQNREPTGDEKTEDGKHFICLFIHSFIPIAACLPGVKRSSKHWGNTCRPYRQDFGFHQAYFLIGEAESQRWNRETGKREVATGKPEGQAEHLGQETDSQDGLPIRGCSPGHTEKLSFFQRARAQTTLVRSSPSKRTNTTSYLYIASSVSLLCHSSSHVSPKATQRGRQWAGIIISILQLGQAARTSLIL